DQRHELQRISADDDDHESERYHQGRGGERVLHAGRRRRDERRAPSGPLHGVDAAVTPRPIARPQDQVSGNVRSSASAPATDRDTARQAVMNSVRAMVQDERGMAVVLGLITLLT